MVLPEPHAGSSSPHRAEPHRIPAPTRALERAEQERAEYIRGREKVEQSRVLRGLVLLAVLVLFLSMLRAGFGRVFPHGWWRP